MTTYRTQSEWIKHFNELGRPMLSVADIYRIGKGGSEEELKRLREDFMLLTREVEEAWFITSTNIRYNLTDLDARVIHNFNSSVVKPNKTRVKIPVYDDEKSLRDLLQIKVKVDGKEKIKENIEGIDYVHALFNTKDKPQRIMETLSNLTLKNPNQIIIWTPDQIQRSDHPENAVVLGYYDDNFHISCDNVLVDLNGSSLGIARSRY